ncbi:hypothetical protein FKM82_013043, partial [Ascaphus truei]
IYEGDTGKWDSHFSTIQTAYKELGKDADFVIRVLTEDFTLPFPYVWGEDDDAGELTQSSQNDPSEEDCWDFFMQPGKPMPRSLQPLHATTQAYFKKRRMEQTAVSFATLAWLCQESPDEATQSLAKRVEWYPPTWREEQRAETQIGSPPPEWTIGTHRK